MCYPTTCRQCGRTTWAGCGEHVADVRRGVPADQWCDGHPDAQPGRGFLGRLLNR
jgi:hypothetical protein